MFISYYLKFPLEFIIFFFYINSGINFNKSIIEFPFHVNSIRQGRLTRCYCIHIHIIPTYILLYPHTCYVLHVSRRHMHQSDVCVWVCVCVYVYRETLIRGQGCGRSFFPGKFHPITDILYHSKHRDYLQ